MRQQSAALALDALSLEATVRRPATSVRLNVRGIDHPLYDPRVPPSSSLFASTGLPTPVAFFDPDHDWRIVVSTGEPVAFMADLTHHLVESAPIDADTIDDLAAAHGVLADLFPADARVA